MRASAAVLYELNRPLVVEDVEVLEPGPHEVLVLDELISRRLPLSEVNAAFDLLRRGEVKRSVIVY
jgi:Zn-dependent alcohol dehydrogenase